MEADIAALQQFPLLQSLSESEQKTLVPLLKPIRKNPGEFLFRQGERGDALYFLFRHDTGETDTFEEIGPGAFFGEVAVFTLYHQRTANAEVTQALEAYELTRDDLLGFLRQHPEAALHLLGGMAERLRRSGFQLQHTPARNLNQEEQEALTQRDRIAKQMAQFAGSPLFLLLHALFFTCWIVFNAQRGEKGFDPYPFHLLGLVVGVEALVFSCFVLMNQSREDKAQARRNNKEYEINVNAEKEVAYLHERLDDLQREIVTRLPPREADARQPQTPGQ